MWPQQWGGLYDIWEVLKKLFTFYVLCLKIRRRRLDIPITTLLERRCLCMFFFGVFYPFLPMLSVGKSMFNTWSSSKNICSSLFSPCDFGSAVFFLSLPHVRFWPYPRTKWFLKTATMSCCRRMLIWSLVDYSSAEPLMPPGTNVLLRKQQLSEKCALWFCNLLFREWIWMLLCWRSRWLWSKLLSGRLEVESSFAHSSCLESHNALFSIFGRPCVRS